MNMPSGPTLPPSATHPVVVLCGVATFILSIFLLREQQLFEESYLRTAYIAAMTAIGIFSADTLWRKIYRKSLSPEPLREGNWPRVLTKCAGLYASLGFVGLMYWLFPEYVSGDKSFYWRYWQFLEMILPWWGALTPPYIWWVDRRQNAPEDTLWHFGRLVTFQWKNLNAEAAGQNILGWTVKAFFVPLMFIYTCNNTDNAVNWNFSGDWDFQRWFVTINFAVFFIDCAFAFMAYLMSMRVFDTQINTTEPTFFGWFVAVMCYPPFTNFIGGQYLAWDHNNIGWEPLFKGSAFYPFYGSIVLFLLSVFAWSTVIFGGRFSNLTNRGIITSGPYRFTKHPAYISKNLAWWLMSLPFIVNGPPSQAIKNCLLLLAFNGIYYLRAKTEERHLSLDPVYRQYAAWIDAHGIFRWLNHIPYVRGLAKFKMTFGNVPKIGTFSNSAGNP